MAIGKTSGLTTCWKRAGAEHAQIVFIQSNVMVNNQDYNELNLWTPIEIPTLDL
jgi:hypothetical protein